MSRANRDKSHFLHLVKIRPQCREAFFFLLLTFYANCLNLHDMSKPGPSCSKLTTSLVNDSLKFTSSDTQIC